MVVLVLGANGQLGSYVCDVLLAEGCPVRGLVRTTTRGRVLADLGVDTVLGDLASPDGLGAQAFDGVTTMVVTANSVVPRAGDDPAAFDAGVGRAIDDAAAAGVSRIVLASVPVTPVDPHVPFVRARRALERRLRETADQSVVLRMPPFMECWLALVGSTVPLRGEPHATIGRPSPFLRRFRAGTATLVERRGLMLVPGSPTHRNAFISTRDVARAVAAAASAEDAAAPQHAEVDVAGPEVLSWHEVAAVFGRLLDRRVRILSMPAPGYAAMAHLLAPVAAVPANTMALNRLMASTETPWSPGGGGLLDPGSMTTVEGFLSAKLALPEELPTVA